jgi:hypothetical protein
VVLGKMDHPFIGDLSKKTVDELLDTINRLSKQQQYMFRLGKHDVVGQINMAIDSYRGEYSRRQQQMWDKKSDTDLDKKIDIS